MDKTIRLLIERKLITISFTGAKNKKFYKIKSKTRLKEYKNDLNQWLFFKAGNKTILTGETLGALDNYQQFLSRIQDTMRKSIKRSKFSARKITDLEKIPFSLTREQQRKITEVQFPKKVFLKSIFFKDAINIISQYKNFLLCDECLKVGKLVDLVIDFEKNERICPKEGHTYSIEK